MRHPPAQLSLAVLILLLNAVSAAAEPLNFVVLARDGSPVSNAVVSSGPRTQTNQATAEMDQVDKAFSPYVLAVGQGTAVNFPNSDQIRHHVYSFSEAKPFELRLYSGVPEAPVNFDEPGVVVVGCNIHDNMIGYIFVSPRANWARTDADGSATLEVTDQTVHVWHPSLSINSQLELEFSLDELERVNDGYKVQLEISPPPAFPQAIKTTDRDRFKRFID